MYLDDHCSEPTPFDGWFDRPLLRERGRLTHLVLLDGRLVDVWSEDEHGTRYAGLAREYDDQLRPQVAAPPPPPRHEQVLAWLERLTGGRTAVLSLDDRPRAVPDLREHLDPGSDEQWLHIGELIDDLVDSVLPAELGGPLREGLLLLRAADASAVDRRTPARVAAGLAWVVGKANGSLGPTGPVVQKDVSARLGLRPNLSSDGQSVRGLVSRTDYSSAPIGWWGRRDDLLPTGRPELLCTRVRADLVRLRDEALAVRRQTPPSEAAS